MVSRLGLLTHYSRFDPMIIRSWTYCLWWSLFTVSFAAVAVRYNSSVGPIESAGFWLLVLYGLQSFFSEIVGFRAGNDAISFPRRLFPGFGLFVFWRRKIAAKSIARIDRYLDNRVQLFTGGRSVDVALAGRDRRREFMKFAKHAYPWIDVF